MPFVKGIDVSVYDPVINWAKVRDQGYRFAIIRSSYGVDNMRTIADSMFAAHWAGAKAAGMIRGAYHYLKAAQDGKAQAVEVLRIVRPETGDLPIFLDIEEVNNETATNKQFMDNANAFLSHIKTETGRTPFVYSRASFLKQKVSLPNGSAPNWAPNFRVWIAHWTFAFGGNINPIEAAGWPAYKFWQYSGERDTLDGITDERGNPVKVDFDVFKGTLEELYTLAGSTAPVSQQYTVVAGDLLENIARQHNISLAELVNANPQILTAGMQLTIPSPAGPAPLPTPPSPPLPTPPPGSQTYTVKAGDTMSGIALKFGTTIRAIADLNHIPDPNLIFIGQVLLIP